MPSTTPAVNPLDIELPATLDASLRDLATRCNGAVYPGDRLEAVIAAVKVLRADPALAQALGIAPTPEADLVQRLAEILAWRKTGLLPQGALHAMADKAETHLQGDVRLAEDQTYKEAAQWIIAQSPTPPVLAPVKPPKGAPAAKTRLR